MLDIARTLSASTSMHALTGSSRPGVVPPLVPLGATIAHEPACGHANAATCGHVDAEVIDLAERVKRLAKREDLLVLRRAKIEEAVDAETPLRPVDVAGPSSFEEGLAAHDRRVAEVGACLGLPRWDKLANRALCRLDRWGSRLAGTAPLTQAGLAAKAEACKVVTATFRHSIKYLYDWRKDLSISVSDDALRIIGAEADARAEQDRQADGELLALGSAWRDCAERNEQALVLRDEAEKRMIEREWPAALCFTEDDPPVLGPYSQPYRETDQRRFAFPAVERLRAPWPYDFCRARRDEILVTYDAWTAQREAYKAAAGLTDAQGRLDRVIAENASLRRRILTIPANTVEGAMVKVDVACWCMGEVEGMEVDLAGHLRDGCADEEALTCGALLDIARVLGRDRAGSAGDLRSSPLPALSSARYPLGASRDEIESYRTFLEFELRFLNHEVYGQTEGRLHYWLDNPAGRLHSGSHAPASSRAAAVLGFLGLMPTESVHRAAQAAGLAQNAASAA